MRWTLLLAAGCTGSLAYYGPGKASGTPGLDGTGPTATGPGTTPTDTTPGGPDTGTGAGTDTPWTDPTETETGRPPGEWVNGDPASPPPYGAPPPTELAGSCASLGGFHAELDDDSVDVESHDDSLDSVELTSPVTGWYEVYGRAMAREGDGEWNESAMIRVSNATSWTGLPVLANCDADWVAVDADNYGDRNGTLFYLGTFWFEAGENEVELEHACPRIRAGSCPELEFLEDDDTTCAANDGNSARLREDDLCLLPPP